MKYYIWDTVDERIVEADWVGEGTLDGKPVVAVRYGCVTEWISRDQLKTEIDEQLKSMKAMARERAKLKR